MDLRKLDRDVMLAARAVHKHRAAAARGEHPADPWLSHRAVARASLYAELAMTDVSMHERELKDALLAWIAWLTVTRVAAPAQEALVVELHANDVVVTIERTMRMSWRAAWQGMMASANAAAARAFCDGLASHGGHIAPFTRRVREIKDEATGRLFGASTLLGLELDESTIAASEAFLNGTKDLARFVRTRSETGPDARPLALDVLSMRGAPEGWPARLTASWLFDLFGAHMKGLELELRLPSLISPASFVRALAELGGAFRLACCGPSTLARSPRFDDPHRFAAAFASLATTASFQRRALGVAPGTAQDQARAVARSQLLSLRLACTTLLVTAGRADPAQASPDDELPRGLAGAWPIARDDEAARARGWMLGVCLAIDLRERHDEDWWRNPRAWEDLRAGALKPRMIDAAAVKVCVTALEGATS